MPRGFFVTFEGLDGSGKTTQIRRLAAWLEAQNLSPLLTRQPGGTPIGDRIRSLLLDSRTSNLAPLTELALMFADRAQAIHEVIQPALAAGRIVLCDRFTDSTEAYQGGGRELGSHVVLDLHRVLCGNLQPDLTFLLSPDAARSLRRARRRNGRGSAGKADESRFESESDPFFARVAAKYSEIEKRDADRIRAIEGNASIEEVHRRIVEEMAKRLRASDPQFASLESV